MGVHVAVIFLHPIFGTMEHQAIVGTLALEGIWVVELQLLSALGPIGADAELGLVLLLV